MKTSEELTKESEEREAERGYVFENEDGSKFWWKFCSFKFCTNHVCRGYSEDFCYVHMPQEARARKDADCLCDDM